MDCGTGPVSQAADAKELMQQNARAVAYTLEAGIVFHSLFVGIALGTSREASYVKGLAIALIFHQVRAAQRRSSLAQAGGVLCCACWLVLLGVCDQ